MFLFFKYLGPDDHFDELDTDHGHAFKHPRGLASKGERRHVHFIVTRGLGPEENPRETEDLGIHANYNTNFQATRCLPLSPRRPLPPVVHVLQRD